MAEFIQKTFEYPEMAREMGEQGTIWVEFVVYSDGKIKDVKVKERGLVAFTPQINDPDGEEIELSVEEMPNGAKLVDGEFIWTPGNDVVQLKDGKKQRKE